METAWKTTKEAAAFLRCSPSTLNKERCRGDAKIPFTKHGVRVLYDQRDLDQALEGKRFTSTAQYPTHAGPGRPRK